MAFLTLNQSDPFTILPVEILHRIYLYMSNLHLPFATKHLYSSLSDEHTRMIFCANLWDPSYDWGFEFPNLAIPQTFVLNQQWFAPIFAQRVESECKKRFRDGNHRGVPATYSSTKLPGYCLRPPWTEEKIALLKILTDWNVRAHWGTQARPYPGFNEAIKQDLSIVVGIYMSNQVDVVVNWSHVLLAIESDAGEECLNLLMAKMICRRSRDGIGNNEVHEAILTRALQDRPLEYRLRTGAESDAVVHDAESSQGGGDEKTGQAKIQEEVTSSISKDDDFSDLGGDDDANAGGAEGDDEEAGDVLDGDGYHDKDEDDETGALGGRCDEDKGEEGDDVERGLKPTNKWWALLKHIHDLKPQDFPDVVSIARHDN